MLCLLDVTQSLVWYLSVVHEALVFGNPLFEVGRYGEASEQCERGDEDVLGVHCDFERRVKSGGG